MFNKIGERMNIQNFSIVAGSEACNARCPYCISKMTPKQGIELKEPSVNWRNFRKGAILARNMKVPTVMITGKGEPTLFPDQISKFMNALEEFEFPFTELQTNGVLLQEQKKKYEPYLKEWYDKGMSTIAISIAHYEPEKNREIFLPHRKHYMELPELIHNLHDTGYSVRLTCMLADGYVDSAKKFENLVLFARDNGVEQLTARPITKPKNSLDDEVAEWVMKHHLKKRQFNEIESYIHRNGVPLLKFFYGGTIYDVKDQNVCLTTCLTLDTSIEHMRQLIFFPDGHLRFDWQYKGAILL